MTTNTIQPTNLDITMEEIDTLVSNFQDSLSRITNKVCKVDTFQLGLTYVVILRAGKISKTLSFNLNELTEEEYQ
ncbi:MULTISPECIES: hypothetical protein [Bacillus cereus group]|uniref:hypothetical protein n=1 Tax=Bacillus cereus group TaxID=86661 RepID=UPI000A38DC33|nr:MULTISPECIES: hypothetical protein [Bacillus cereus group]MED2173075.1 hypothetical protein [Bacillus thuringiensis]MED2478880.1 hypothetical protein [Bacillus thuringiensis]MED2575926.1 hypothetical protein [Bacillus thuringiensis]MED2651421.1 hypothetical protein [Bacillus thuringiensis]MED3506918.1 hypothetical protein [Bacillus thuringiensis]